MAAKTKNTRPKARTNRKTSDSSPAVFSTVDLQDMGMGQDKWLNFEQPLDFINVDAIRQCISEALRGAYARIQWMWEQLEPADAFLATAIEKRESALGRIPWKIEKKADLTDIEDSIAEAQLRTINDFFNAVDNTDEAIKGFAQASFRHYRHIQMVETGNKMRFVPSDNWNWVRDGYDGSWLWNPRASYGLTKGQPIPVDPRSLLTRVCPRPIDHVAMMLCLDRKNAKAQWMTFNGRYGVPPLFVVLPPGLSEEAKQEHIKFALKCISNSSGVLSPGADVKTLSVQGTGGPETFKGVIDMSNQELVLRATGGLMTMLTAPGAGTTEETGNTHQKAFDDLAAEEGKEISRLMTAGVVNPLLDQWHPGQPYLVEFVIRHPEADDTQINVDLITRLRAAGYNIAEEQVTDLTGFEITTGGGIDSATLYALKAAGYAPQMAPLQEQVGIPLKPAPADIKAAISRLDTNWRRYKPLMQWDPARKKFDRDINIKKSILTAYLAREAAESEPPLTTQEQDQYARLVQPPADSDIAELAKTLSLSLKRAMGPLPDNNAKRTPPPVATPLQSANLPSPETENEADINYGTSEGARKGWDKRGRGRRDDWQKARMGMTSKQNASNATRAMRWAMNNGKDAERVMYRKGLGWVDFPIGRPGTKKANAAGATHTDGYGLSHIEAKHGERALRRMPLVLSYGKVSRHARDKDKMSVTQGNEVVHLRKSKGGNRSWAITSYDELKEGKRDDY